MAHKQITHKQLAINMVGEIDVNRISKVKEFPLNTRYTDASGRDYRYVVDKDGYRWIGEELWFKLADAVAP